MRRDIDEIRCYVYPERTRIWVCGPDGQRTADVPADRAELAYDWLVAEGMQDEGGAIWARVRTVDGDAVLTRSDGTVTEVDPAEFDAMVDEALGLYNRWKQWRPSA